MASDVRVLAGDASLCVRDYGGSGIGIVLLHGAGGNAAEFDLVGPMLAARGFRAIALDERGDGMSELGTANDHHIRVDDVRRVVEALGIGAPVVVGQSAGANTAVLYAVSNACLGLVTCDFAPTGQTWITWEGFEEGMRSNPLWFYDFVGSDDELVRTAEAAWSARNPHLPLPPSKLRFEYFSRNLARGSDGVWRSRLTLDEALAGIRPLWDYSMYSPELWSDIPCPVMLLTAEGSGFMTSERVARLRQYAPALRVESIDSGHMMHWERPLEVSAVIADFAHQASDRPSTMA